MLKQKLYMTFHFFYKVFPRKAYHHHSIFSSIEFSKYEAISVIHPFTIVNDHI